MIALHNLVRVSLSVGQFSVADPMIGLWIVPHRHQPWDEPSRDGAYDLHSDMGTNLADVAILCIEGLDPVCCDLRHGSGCERKDLVASIRSDQTGELSLCRAAVRTESLGHYSSCPSRCTNLTHLTTMQ